MSFKSVLCAGQQHRRHIQEWERYAKELHLPVSSELVKYLRNGQKSEQDSSGQNCTRLVALVTAEPKQKLIAV